MLAINCGVTITCDYEPGNTAAIRSAYDTEDEYFFRRIHKRHGTKEECIIDSANSISIEAKMYVVRVDGKFAGFFVKTPVGADLAMEGFHIIRHYREQWFVKAFWDIVRTTFERSFFTAVYELNFPAVRHLHRVGFNVVRHFPLQGKNYFLFTLNF